MIQKLDIAKNADKTLFILSNMANRHGLITGATGTGKTVTLQKIAESFSAIGVPVLLTDIKGDLTGLGMAAIRSDKLQRHLDSIGIKNWQPAAFPIDLWDIFADKGHPIRATVSDIGPLLFSRLLNLNQIQSGVLQLIFKIADDNQLLLLDFKDLRAFVQFIGDNAKQFTTEYGNISTSSIGAIQRSLLTLEQQGAEYFLGEPMFDIQDLIRTNDRGQGIINVLEAEKLYQLPLLYSVFLLWFVSELFETLPEVGDLDKPKLILFFDEAHLLFNQTPPALLSKIEQVVRLIRSKGVGIYFVTQNPTDIPDTILGQLGHRIQHALRAFTPRDLKSIKVAAQTLRQNPAINTEQAITELAIGEALISFLDEKGQPNEVERSFIITPQSQMGIISENEQQTLITHSPLYGKYEPQLDRQSAYEQLQSGFTFNTKPSNGAEHSQQNKPPSQINENQNKDFWTMIKGFLFGDQRAKGGTKEGVVPGVAKSITRNMVNRLGREITRGILGNLTKRRK